MNTVISIALSSSVALDQWLMILLVLSINKAVYFVRRCICHIEVAPPRECSEPMDAAVQSDRIYTLNNCKNDCVKYVFLQTKNIVRYMYYILLKSYP